MGNSQVQTEFMYSYFNPITKKRMSTNSKNLLRREIIELDNNVVTDEEFLMAALFGDKIVKTLYSEEGIVNQFIIEVSEEEIKNANRKNRHTEKFYKEPLPVSKNILLNNKTRSVL